MLRTYGMRWRATSDDRWEHTKREWHLNSMTLETENKANVCIIFDYALVEGGYVHVSAGAYRDQQRFLNPLELEFQAVVSCLT